MEQGCLPGVAQGAHRAVGLDDNAAALAALDVLAVLAYQLDRLLNEDHLLVETWRYEDSITWACCADYSV